MRDKWKEMLALADAMQVTLEMKFGGLKQPRPALFKVANTELTYSVDLIQGFVSPDYETAAAVFHIGYDGYILAEKIGRNLEFHMLNLDGQPESKLLGKSKNPRSLSKQAKQFTVGRIGSSQITA